MGELLRAICDASCVYSAPSFYVARITTAMTVAAHSYAERQTILQLKADTYFLLMGWAQEIAQGPGNGLTWEQKSAPSNFLLRDVKTSKTYGNLPMSKSNAGYNLNNIVTLPEYILWPPASLIGVIQKVPITDPTFARSDAFVTLVGIEYQMQAGRP